MDRLLSTQNPLKQLEKSQNFSRVCNQFQENPKSTSWKTLILLKNGTWGGKQGADCSNFFQK